VWSPSSHRSALCLITHDVPPEVPSRPIEVYYSYEPDLLIYRWSERR
jgi:hypothetical protein